MDIASSHRVSQHTIVPPKVSVIVGNGDSRHAFDLHNISRRCSIVGCNAIYRDYKPDLLVVVDDDMVKEVMASYKGLTFYVDADSKRTYLKDLSTGQLYLDLPDKGLNAGNLAAWIASTRILEGEGVLFFIGFDFNNGNVYMDTKNYRESADKPLNPKNWFRYFCDIIADHPHITYVRLINELSGPIRDDISDLYNYREVQIEEMRCLGSEKVLKCFTR